MSARSTTINIIEEFKEEILEKWRNRDKAGTPRTFELITEDEYNAQNRSLLDEIISVYMNHITVFQYLFSSEFNGLRAVLDEIIADKVERKFMPTVIPNYITILSNSILELLNDKITDPETLSSESKYLTSFMEFLAQYAYESFLTSTENLTKIDPDRFSLEQKLKGLHIHATQLNQAKFIQEVVNHTIDAMVTTLGFGQIGFMMVEGDYLREWSSFIPIALDPKTGKRTHFKLHLGGKGITVKALKAKRTLRIPDVREDPDYVHPHVYVKDALPREWRSNMAVPVFAGDDVIAVLNVESEDIDAFSLQDQELMETLASHVSSAIQRIKNREKVRELAYKLNNLVPGRCYLSESHERCLKAYAVLSMEDVPGLCIVREDPQLLVDKYGIKAEDIKLLSSRPFKGFKALKDLQSVSLAISSFLKSGKGVILFDGLEYLITRFGFDTVYSFVQEKRFDVLESEAVLLIPLNMDTLDSREKALLSSEFNLLE